jgi:hypothetical protein
VMPLVDGLPWPGSFALILQIHQHCAS